MALYRTDKRLKFYQRRAHASKHFFSIHICNPRQRKQVNMKIKNVECTSTNALDEPTNCAETPTNIE